MTTELHNMSVPPTSVVAVRRVGLPGRRFRVELGRRGSADRLQALEQALAREGWRAAWRWLAARRDAPASCAAGGRRRPRPARETLDAHLESALVAAGVPTAVGVFLEEPDDGTVPRLGPAAALAVLSRRSGPVYLPGRRFEPSLARLSPAVLFFPSTGGPADAAPEVTP